MRSLGTAVAEIRKFRLLLQSERQQKKTNAGSKSFLHRLESTKLTRPDSALKVTLVLQSLNVPTDAAATSGFEKRCVHDCVGTAAW